MFSLDKQGLKWAKEAKNKQRNKKRQEGKNDGIQRNPATQIGSRWITLRGREEVMTEVKKQMTKKDKIGNFQKKNKRSKCIYNLLYIIYLYISKIKFSFWYHGPESR